MSVELAQLHKTVLYIFGKRTSDYGHMSMRELVEVNRTNTIKGNGREWKLYTVDNPFTA